MDKKQRKQPQPIAFYLGKEQTEDRLRNIDALVTSLGLRNRSELLQMIADDKLEVRRREPAQQSA